MAGTCRLTHVCTRSGLRVACLRFCKHLLYKHIGVKYSNLVSMVLDTSQLGRVQCYLKGMDCFETLSGGSGRYFINRVKICYNVIEGPNKSSPCKRVLL